MELRTGVVGRMCAGGVHFFAAGGGLCNCGAQKLRQSTPSLAEIDALEARVKELEQLVRDFAGPHAKGVFSHQCPACSAERQLRAIGKELAT
jgi:hypothetical protein